MAPIVRIALVITLVKVVEKFIGAYPVFIIRYYSQYSFVKP